MNRLLFFFVSMTFFFSAKSQTNYAEAMQQGDAAFNKQEYKKAINKYFAAEAFDPSKKDKVKVKVNLVFDRIEKLRTDAERAQMETDKARIAEKYAKNEAIKGAAATQLALDKTQRLIGTFYFYAHRFAPAYQSRVRRSADLNIYDFYYIDENGDAAGQLGEWEEAGPFKETGFATVKRGGRVDNKMYIIDTFGHEYLSANTINNIDSSILALDLSGKEWPVFPLEVMDNEQLQVFILSGTYFSRKHISTIPDNIGRLKNLENLQLAYCSIDTLSPKIGYLKKLTYLDLEGNNISILPGGLSELEHLISLKLAKNKLRKLPPEIGKLKNLRELSLWGNEIPEWEQQKIKKLLPNCSIGF